MTRPLISEFKTSVSYRGSSKTIKATEKPYLESPPPQKKKKKTKKEKKRKGKGREKRKVKSRIRRNA